MCAEIAVFVLNLSD